MKKKKLLAQIIAAGLICWAFIAIGEIICSERDNSEAGYVNVDSLNLACYDACLDDIMVCVALTEGFYEKPYFCKARWTIGYGSTILPDGSPVTPKTKPVTKMQAKEYVYSHLNKHVKPFLKYVHRVLKPQEMIATCDFIYNIGGDAFSGYDEDGNCCGEPSNFLLAINEGESAEECARRFTGFRSSEGQRADGLLKRRWIEGAVFLGKLKVEQFMELQPECFYNDTISFYYESAQCAEDDYFDYDFRPETLRKFIENNRHDTNNVRAII